MPYVERNTGGEIIGIYGRPQPDIAEEKIDVNDPAIAAFHKSRQVRHVDEIDVLRDALRTKGIEVSDKEMNEARQRLS